MKDIELNELPKSKEFMQHAKIADRLTKETGLEHGFIFCKENDKIVVDNICSGTDCQINIKRQERCYGNSHITFHTHPNRKKSELSIADLTRVVNKSFNFNEPGISCVKADEDDNIFCVKSDVLDIEDISAINEKFYDTTSEYMEKEDFIYDMMIPEIILFDSKKGKIT